jgi:hypothetical protein
MAKLAKIRLSKPLTQKQVKIWPEKTGISLCFTYFYYSVNFENPQKNINMGFGNYHSLKCMIIE